MRKQSLFGWMVALFASVVFVSLLTGCDSVGGTLRPDGSISPCGGHHTDSKACGYATWNAKVIGGVETGQTKQQVRNVMKHDPERREMDGAEERWYYMTDYQAELMTMIVFTNGSVTAMKQVPWKTD